VKILFLGGKLLMVLVILSFLAAMEDRLLLAVELFGQLAAALRGLLGRVETLERQVVVGAVVVAGLTAEQTELMDLPHYQAETAMVEQVEILEQGVLEERGVLAQ
jgi:hypothetical protein